jgi:hypothetical protein
VPEPGQSFAQFEIKEISSSCAEKNSTFKVDGDMICNYNGVGLEKLEHPLAFTATSRSKVEIEEVEGTKTPRESAVFEVTDKVHLSSGWLWSAH